MERTGISGKLRHLMAGAMMLATILATGPMSAAPSVFPTGATIYDPERAYNGYTVLSILGTRAVVVIDMNGKIVKQWDGFNLSAGGPARILPGGIAMATKGDFPGHLETTQLLAKNFEGQELWQFDRSEPITVEGKRQWSARQHHDWQRSDFPAGYYSPRFTPRLDGGKTLLLTHTSHSDPAIADVSLDDDRLIELDGDKQIIWQWRAGDHIDDFGFRPAARRAIKNAGRRDHFDWFHINAATYVGPNKWFEAGDARFDPGNVIISSRQTSIIAIIARDGSLVWKIGPNFSDAPAQTKIGQIIGPHHAHFIPPGLPGAGNMLIFDNGGASGYGAPSDISPDGLAVHKRHNSRVLELDPVTLDVVWQYDAPNFFSFNISGAQRLPNGNTLITEGAPGRIFEVNAQKEVVWEYINPPGQGPFASNAVYRAYRLPYGWIPQLPVPQQIALTPPAPGTFHVPGAPVP